MPELPEEKTVKVQLKCRVDPEIAQQFKIALASRHETGQKVFEEYVNSYISEAQK